MSDRVKWEVFNGVKYLFTDYSALEKEGISKIMEEAESEIIKQPINSVRIISLVNNSFFNDEIKNLASKYAQKIKPYIFKTAAVGFTGFKTIILKVISPAAKTFVTLDDAKKWITE